MIEKKELIEKVNSMSEFNKWCGIKVLSATEGAVEIQIEWRKEMGQYSGFLHAGLIGTLIDTACGFAADNGRHKIACFKFFSKLLATCNWRKIYCEGKSSETRKATNFHCL